MDPLIDIQSVPIVQKLMSVRSECSGSYAVQFSAYEHVKFVALLHGRFDLQIESDANPTSVGTGDCYMLTDGRAYRIFNANVSAADAATLYSADRGVDGVVRWGVGVVDTVTIGTRAVLNAQGEAWVRCRLPPLIHIPAGTAEAARFCAILNLLCGESEAALGATFAADRYVGILLVQVLRHLSAGAGDATAASGQDMQARQ
jgi:hypothetical protein